MDLLSLDPSQFITLTPVSIAFLLAVGFVGGLVSGFIGSGGAFIVHLKLNNTTLFIYPYCLCVLSTDVNDCSCTGEQIVDTFCDAGDFCDCLLCKKGPFSSTTGGDGE